MEAVRRIEVLDRNECLALLSRGQVGRVAWLPEHTTPPAPVAADRVGLVGAPAMVPVTFLVDGDSVVVRTVHGSRLGREAPGRPVTFEADEVRHQTREGWSVIASGVAQLETDPVETRRLAGLLQSWAPGFKDLWLRVPLQHVSGRRLGAGVREIELRDQPRPRWREPVGWTAPTRTPAEVVNDFDGR